MFKIVYLKLGKKVGFVFFFNIISIRLDQSGIDSLNLPKVPQMVPPAAVYCVLGSV